MVVGEKIGQIISQLDQPCKDVDIVSKREHIEGLAK